MSASDFVLANPTAATRWCATPSLRETSLLYLCSALLFVTTIVAFANYGEAVHNFGDSPDYSEIASSIRHWDFSDLHAKQFWGYPYAMAAVSLLTRLSDQGSLLLLSFSASLASILLAYRLWGGWIAGFVAVLNFDWLQRSFLGGSEPLFVLLLFAFFWAVRKEKWASAALLASLATVTRPVGIFALAALATFLLKSRKFKELSLCLGIGLLVGTLYTLPFLTFSGDPSYGFHRYRTDWGSAAPIGLPFSALAFSFAHSHVPWTNVLLNCGWLALVLAGAIAMCRPGAHSYALERPIEFWFAVLYITFLLTYNSNKWALAEFPRFAIPVLPMVFTALDRWFPHDRRILWALGAVSPVLAAASALGIRNVAHALLK